MDFDVTKIIIFFSVTTFFYAISIRQYINKSLPVGYKIRSLLKASLLFVILFLVISIVLILFFDTTLPMFVEFDDNKAVNLCINALFLGGLMMTSALIVVYSVKFWLRLKGS